MKQQEYKISKSFLKESQYAVQLSDELENNAEGLIFDRYIHDIGMQLHIDVLFEKASNQNGTWFLGGDYHVQMVLKEEPDHYVLTLSALDEHGESLLQTLNISIS